MAPLTLVGKELIRNRTAATTEACRVAAGHDADSRRSWRESSDWRVKLGAGAALGKHGAQHEACKPELRALLFSHNDEVRRTAAAALPAARQGSGGQEVAPDRTQTLLRSDDWRVRAGTVEALGKQGSAAAPYAADAAALLADPDAAVRGAAARGLKGIGIAASQAVARALCGAAAGIFEDGEALLLDLTKGDSFRVRVLLRDAAAQAMAPAEAPQRPPPVAPVPVEEFARAGPPAASGSQTARVERQSFFSSADAIMGGCLSARALGTENQPDIFMSTERRPFFSSADAIFASLQSQASRASPSRSAAAGRGGSFRSADQLAEALAAQDASMARSEHPGRAATISPESPGALIRSTTISPEMPGAPIRATTMSPESPGALIRATTSSPEVRLVPAEAPAPRREPPTPRRHERSFEPSGSVQWGEENLDRRLSLESQGGNLDRTISMMTQEHDTPRASTPTRRAKSKTKVSFETSKLSADPDKNELRSLMRSMSKSAELSPRAESPRLERSPSKESSSSSPTRRRPKKGLSTMSMGSVSSGRGFTQSFSQMSLGSIMRESSRDAVSLQRSGTSSTAFGAMSLTADDLATLLEDDAKHRRLAALKRFAQLDPEEVLPYADLVAARLDDPDVRVRCAAAGALGFLGDDLNVAHSMKLEGLLEDENAVLRQACARALGDAGAAHAAPRVAGLLEDKDPQVRQEAQHALAALGPAAAASCTADKLRHPDEKVREFAQKALLAMCDEDQEAGRPAYEVLKPHVEGALADADALSRRAAVQVLVRLGAPMDRACEVAARCNAALLEDPDESVRVSSLRRLGTFGKDAEPHAAAVAERLADDAEPVRRAAKEALAQLGSTHAHTALLVVTKLLSHRLQTVRRAATTAMEQIDSAQQPQGAAQRHVALLADEAADVRCKAVDALAEICKAGELGAEQTAAAVALRIDPHWCVRLSATKLLCHCDAATIKRHQADLAIMLRDVDWRVRRAAGVAQEKIGGSSARA